MKVWKCQDERRLDVIPAVGRIATSRIDAEAGWAVFRDGCVSNLEPDNVIDIYLFERHHYGSFDYFVTRYERLIYEMKRSALLEEALNDLASGQSMIQRMERLNRSLAYLATQLYVRP